MAKEAKFKSEDGKKTLTVKIDEKRSGETSGGGDDVQAYQAGSSETFTAVSADGSRILTITIAE